MNSQTSTEQTKARPNKKTAESAKNICYKTKSKLIKWRSRHFRRLRLFRESRFGCPGIARVASSEELGTMSKNNLRGITLVRGPIWGIHSLTLIISWWCSFTTCLSSRGKLIVSNASKKPLRICLNYILASADKQRPCWQFYGIHKVR